MSLGGQEMRKLTDGLEGLARWGVGLSFGLLMVAVLIQLLGRGGVIAAPIWTEELSRFALLYLAAFGAGLAIRSGDMVNVDLISESLPGNWPWRLRLFSALAVAGLSLILLPAAWFYTTIGSRQTSPALGLRMDMVHGAILLLLVLLGLFALARAIGMISGTEDGRAIKIEEDE